MSHDDTGEVAARTTLKAVHMDTSARKSCAIAAPIARKAAARMQPAGARDGAPAGSSDPGRAGALPNA